MDIRGWPVRVLSRVLKDHRIALGNLKGFRLKTLVIDEHGELPAGWVAAAIELGAGRDCKSQEHEAENTQPEFLICAICSGIR